MERPLADGADDARRPAFEQVVELACRGAHGRRSVARGIGNVEIVAGGRLAHGDDALGYVRVLDAQGVTLAALHGQNQVVAL